MARKSEFVIPKGVGALVAQAYKTVIEKAREHGIEMTLNYNHNVDKPETKEAMLTTPFFQVYSKEPENKLNFLMYSNCSRPETEIDGLALERIANYRETVHPTGDGDERTETYSGIVMLRSTSSGPYEKGQITRVKVSVTLFFATNNNMFNSKGFGQILNEREADKISA